MKQIAIVSSLKSIFAFVVLSILQIPLLAQDTYPLKHPYHHNNNYNNMVYPAMGMGCGRSIIAYTCDCADAGIQFQHYRKNNCD